MNKKQGNEIPIVDTLQDRVLANSAEGVAISVSTTKDAKSVLEDNPYFNKNKTYNKEELEEFKKFFSH